MSWEPLPSELEPLPHFACYLLRELGLADTPTKQQLGILNYLENGPDRQIITAYRGHRLLCPLASPPGPFQGEDPAGGCHRG
jgi:hypothetical protein